MTRNEKASISKKKHWKKLWNF